MRPFTSFSVRMYSRMLRLYPFDLRRDFGEDMTAAFAEDLACACQTGSVAALARVWYCSLREFFCIALPGHRDNPAVLVPLLSFMLTAVWFGMTVLFTAWQDNNPVPVGNLWYGPFAVAFVSAVVTTKPKFISLAL